MSYPSDKFKVGDSVIVINVNDEDNVLDYLIGESGTIKRINPNHEYPYEIKYDNSLLNEQHIALWKENELSFTMTDLSGFAANCLDCGCTDVKVRIQKPDSIEDKAYIVLKCDNCGHVEHYNEGESIE